MNKQDIYNFLDNRGIWYEVSEHDAVYNMEELAEIELPYPDNDAKNIFVYDDKKVNYYLITTTSKKRVDLKKFRQVYNTRPLRFVTEEDMVSIINLTAGSVTPFGILNDKECKINCFIDEDFTKIGNIIGIHPNDNTATVWLKVDDLVDIIKEHGNMVQVCEILERDN